MLKVKRVEIPRVHKIGTYLTVQKLLLASPACTEKQGFLGN